jgi:protein arginine kinase
MKFSKIIANSGEWLSDEGPNRQIVVTSRVRLARNIAGKPFPGWAKKAERLEVMERVKASVEGLPEMAESYSEKLEALSPLEKQVLVERHLISREHAAKGVGSAVVMNSSQSLSVMINEEDHLRMQAITSGLRLPEAYMMIDRVDSALEEQLDVAFDEKLGYLTSCPTNVGTGMRASAMLHLPGLVMSEQINKIINSVNKIGLAVRGLHGEGSEAMGNLFQVSNQTTLGESESEIIGRLNRVIEQIIEHEQNARGLLSQRKTRTLIDQIGRAYGLLSYAYAISSKEALNLLSVIKLGIDLGVFPDAHRFPVDELFIETQPAHLQKGAGTQKMSSEERDSLRADLIRARLSGIPKPDVERLTTPNPGRNQAT